MHRRASSWGSLLPDGPSHAIRHLCQPDKQGKTRTRPRFTSRPLSTDSFFLVRVSCVGSVYVLFSLSDRSPQTQEEALFLVCCCVYLFMLFVRCVVFSVRLSFLFLVLLFLVGLRASFRMVEYTNG
jgi:Flp pilus assembly protein TadB